MNVRKMSQPVNIFKPITVGKMQLKNRLALPPLTRSRATEDHVPTPVMAEYYSQRSSEPGTLIVAEATIIKGQAGGYRTVPGIWTKAQIDGWKPVVDAIHKNKSYVFVQLWALGRAAVPEFLAVDGFDYVAPSAVAIKDKFYADTHLTPNKERPAPRALTTAEVKEYVQWYAQAAKNAIEAGADGVEIHGANGYLVDQFLHPNTNTRTDEYGGSIENRARFALEIIDAITEAIGAERLAIRLSPWGGFGDVEVDVSPIPQWSYLVAELERRAQQGKRIAYISTMEARFMQDEALLPAIVPEDVYTLNDFIGQIWSGPWMRSGNAIHTLKLADNDDRTLLGVGRHFLANPDLLQRVEKHAELNPYNRDTFYWNSKVEGFEKPTGYTDYPFLNGSKL